MSGRYTRIDRLGLFIPIAVSLVYPQYWLAGNPWGWGAFWILFLGAAAEMRTYVCHGCTNRYCPVRRLPDVEPSEELRGGE